MHVHWFIIAAGSYSTGAIIMYHPDNFLNIRFSGVGYIIRGLWAHTLILRGEDHPCFLHLCSTISIMATLPCNATISALNDLLLGRSAAYLQWSRNMSNIGG